MKQAGLAISILICLGAAHAHKKPPRLLTGAAHCLAIKNFLPSSPAERPSFGYFLDQKSYPGDRVIYVVNYAAPGRPNGWVFVIFLTEHDGRQNFNVQNNARFVLSKNEPIGVSFVDPPLGGTWTQQHIAMAIKRIEKRARFILTKKDLLAATPFTTCESYTENLRSHF